MFLIKRIGQSIHPKNSFIKNLIFITVYSIALMVILAALSMMIYHYFPALKPGYDYASRYALIVTLIIFALLPAVYEELIFRKFLLNFLRKRLPDLKAVLLSSLIFAVFHMSVIQGIAAFIFGVFLAVIAIRTRSVIFCIYAHLLNNLLFILWPRL